MNFADFFGVYKAPDIDLVVMTVCTFPNSKINKLSEFPVKMLAIHGIRFE